MPTGISFVFGFKLLARDQPSCFGVEGTRYICIFSLDIQTSEEPEQGEIKGRITMEAVGSMCQLWALVVEEPERKYNSKVKDLYLNVSPPLCGQFLVITSSFPFPLVLERLGSGFVESTACSC